jgi:hypothetical protein
MKSKGVIQKVGLIITVACLSVMTVGGDGSLTNKAQAQERLPDNNGCPSNTTCVESYTEIGWDGGRVTTCPTNTTTNGSCCM